MILALVIAFQVGQCGTFSNRNNDPSVDPNYNNVSDHQDFQYLKILGIEGTDYVVRYKIKTIKGWGYYKTKMPIENIDYNYEVSGCENF